MKNTVTVILGAGSTMDTGNPGDPKGMFSTEELTRKLIKDSYPEIIDPGSIFIPKTDSRLDPKTNPPVPISHSYHIPIIPLIHKSLKAQYEVVDFELMLHAIEQLMTFSDTVRYLGTADPFRHVLASFVEIQNRYKLLNDPMLLKNTHDSFISSIIFLIMNRIYMCGNLEKTSLPLKNTFDALKKSFSLKTFTLNYDDIIDEAFPDGIDGFTDGESDTTRTIGIPVHLSNFDRKLFLEAVRSDSPLLVHLHGSVRFGYASYPDKIAKFGSSQKAYDSIVNTVRASATDTRNGEYFGSDPIISGLNKVSKLIHNPVPFGYYYQALTNSILNSSKLLVIGYSARDEHINTWIREFVKIHGEKRRVVWISKICGDRIGMDHEHEINFLREIAGNGEFQDWRACLKFLPSNHFQDHGPYLRLIPSGFPFQSDSMVERIIKFLNE